MEIVRFSNFLGLTTLIYIELCYLNALFLADERDNIQKKTFTKWVNKHLTKVRFTLKFEKKLENRWKTLYSNLFSILFPFLDPYF